MENKSVSIKVTGTQPFMGREIPVVLGGFGPDARCICDKTAAEIHGMREPDIRRRISDNIERFNAGVDYLDMTQRVHPAHTLEILLSLGYSKQAITQAEHIYILSERGYFKLVKILNSDQAWDVYENLLSDYFAMREERKSIKDKSGKYALSEAKLNNSRARMAAEWRKLAEFNPVPEYQQICAHYASSALAGKPVLPLPETKEHTYTAEEVGKMLGVSGNKIGRIANENHLKTPEYGVEVWDKSRFSQKQVPAWRYNQKGIDRIKDILDR